MSFFFLFILLSYVIFQIHFPCFHEVETSGFVGDSVVSFDVFLENVL